MKMKKLLGYTAEQVGKKELRADVRLYDKAWFGKEEAYVIANTEKFFKSWAVVEGDRQEVAKAYGVSERTSNIKDDVKSEYLIIETTNGTMEMYCNSNTRIFIWG